MIRYLDLLGSISARIIPVIIRRAEVFDVFRYVLGISGIMGDAKHHVFLGSLCLCGPFGP